MFHFQQEIHKSKCLYSTPLFLLRAVETYSQNLIPSCRVDPTEDGDYRLCFDNSFSQLSEKMVFFKVIINRRSGTGGAQDEWADAVVTENMVEYRLEDVRVRRENKVLLHLLQI